MNHNTIDTLKHKVHTKELTEEQKIFLHLKHEPKLISETGEGEAKIKVWIHPEFSFIERFDGPGANANYVTQTPLRHYKK